MKKYGLFIFGNYELVNGGFNDFIMDFDNRIDFDDLTEQMINYINERLSDITQVAFIQVVNFENKEYATLGVNEDEFNQWSFTLDNLIHIMRNYFDSMFYEEDEYPEFYNQCHGCQWRCSPDPEVGVSEGCENEEIWEFSEDSFDAIEKDENALNYQDGSVECPYKE